DRMKNAAVGCAKVGGDVASLLLLADDAEGSDALERRDEILLEILAHFGVRQGVHTERLGVVSGELALFEVPRDVQDEDELLLLECPPGGGRRRLLEMN